MWEVHSHRSSRDRGSGSSPFSLEGYQVRVAAKACSVPTSPEQGVSGGGAPLPTSASTPGNGRTSEDAASPTLNIQYSYPPATTPPGGVGNSGSSFTTSMGQTVLHRKSLHSAAVLSKRLAATVNFRDVNLVTSEAPVAPEDMLDPSLDSSEYSKLCTGVQKSKLIIIMVGLPGRGKTFLCNKLMRYLNWLGHATRHFNVGQYRRKQKGTEEVQDAAFFDHGNEAGMEARHRALYAALEDMMQWLDSDSGQVAIFDATNSTEQRRQLLRQHFHGRWQYMLIETICNDDEVLRQNYTNKMKYSPDYTGVPTSQALDDFQARIRKYEEVYETVTDRSFHYIKLIDMVTGRGHMDINRISGYIPGKIVFFLMQVCKAGISSVRKLWLTRHGQSEYNREERLGGDSSISSDGERYAALLPAALLSRMPLAEPISLSVWTSTLKRTIQTARHLPFPKLQWKALDEIDAGVCDGMTYEEVAERMPEEYAARKQDKLNYRYPSGESYQDLIQRLEPVITEMERERECVAIVSHQAVLRVVYGYFMGVPPDKIPSLEIPLHTLIELTPRPDGTMAEARVAVDIDRGEEQFPSPPASLSVLAGSSPPGPAAGGLLSSLYGPPSASPRPAAMAAPSAAAASPGAGLPPPSPSRSANTTSAAEPALSGASDATTLGGGCVADGPTSSAADHAQRGTATSAGFAHARTPSRDTLAALVAATTGGAAAVGAGSGSPGVATLGILAQHHVTAAGETAAAAAAVAAKKAAGAAPGAKQAAAQ